MPNFIRILPFWPEAAEGGAKSAALACRYAVLCGSDPDGLHIQILFHLLDAGFTTTAAHLIAAERYGRVHPLVAVDPHGAGAQPFRKAMGLTDIAGPHAAA